MIITKEILTQLRDEAEAQRVQALAAANARAGQVDLLDRQILMLDLPPPKLAKAAKAR